MASQVGLRVDTGSCASVRPFNATSCSVGKMSYSIRDPSANTNHTVSMAVWNRGGDSRASSISVITKLTAGEPDESLLLLIVIIIIIITRWAGQSPT